jgi:nitrite reductase/ring-hydroxylating ferredoxin subunit
VTERRVLASGDLAPGELREIIIRERRVLVGRLRSGEVFASKAECPHEGAPLSKGTIRGEAIDCPRHHYLFAVRSGENLYPLPIYPAWKRDEVGDLRLRIFPCEERDGWISILGAEEA